MVEEREGLSLEQEAAYVFVDTMATRRDGLARDGAPFWYGWALREAFAAGATWQRDQVKLPPLLPGDRALEALVVTPIGNEPRGLLEVRVTRLERLCSMSPDDLRVRELRVALRRATQATECE